ncbi:MAG: multidrug efflux RND transporter permease subunit [Gammaproteobacteria bacterium]|nr:hydrophobe/amphiphile efflux-1 family RND transporter [Gammaproteobacteria bacterium]
MTTRFFIDRPVLSWVIALTILLAGTLSLRALPIEQYPSIAPPSLSIEVVYPGADATVVAENVTQVIEQQLNGVDGFQYMSSTSRSDGATISVTFEPGTDIDVAQMDVQNRLNAVEQRLPEEVRRQGVQVFQASQSFLMIIALVSKSGATDTLELGNFASARVVDELRRVDGVGDVIEFSSPYAMRIWLDPERLSSYRLSPVDVLEAVRAQNSQAAGGATGNPPHAEGVELTATLKTQGRFETPEEFASIILRANADGSAVRLGDVADVELGAESYLFSIEIDGRPAAGMAVQLATNANALATSERVVERMNQLALGFPDDIDWTIAFDTTPFIRISIEEVVVTLAVAMALIVLVMFVFLQSFRSTLIPTIVVPISLAGGALGLALFGFSINVLTLFAMVLAIGILVDDAIVVVENVERIMEEEGLPAYEATVKAMGQITTAVIASTLVLVSVFVPMAFFPGSTGSIYRQFSLTLATSIAFSMLLALTLAPALCAALLEPRKPRRASNPFELFNRGLKHVTERYQRAVGAVLARPVLPLAIFAVLAVSAAALFVRMPESFVPEEDQGVLLTVVQAPPGATLDRTEEAIDQVVAFYQAEPAVESVALVRGFSFFGQGQSNAMTFVTLDDWSERDDEGSAAAIVERAGGALAAIKEALVFALNPPPIPELGESGGFTFVLQDRAGHGHEALVAARNQLLGAASRSPVFAQVRPEGQPDAPQLDVDIDRIAARALGLPIPAVNETLSIAMGSAYANDFMYEGRVQRVLVEAAAPFRMTPQDVLDLEVRSETGRMVPFGAFTTVKWTSGPTALERYNGYPSMTIAGSPAPGYSTGEALDEMERLAAALPAGFAFEWTGLSYEERQAAGQVAPLLLLSIVAVFFVLAALYESWSIPVAVLLVVPLGVLGAALASVLRGLPADVYFNIGLIALIGLAARNAILIVQFAIEEEDAGRDPREATLGAVRLRLRPILMTSLTFVFAMVPLVIASGAGAASRIAVGTGVMGGMIAATALGLFFTPLFYLTIRRRLAGRGTTLARRAGAGPTADSPHA